MEKVHWRIKGISRCYLLRVLRQSKVGLGRSIHRLHVEGEVLLSRPGSMDLRDFAMLPTAFNGGFKPRSINNLEKKK